MPYEPVCLHFYRDISDSLGPSSITGGMNTTAPELGAVTAADEVRGEVEVPSITEAGCVFDQLYEKEVRSNYIITCLVTAMMDIETLL